MVRCVCWRVGLRDLPAYGWCSQVVPVTCSAHSNVPAGFSLFARPLCLSLLVRLASAWPRQGSSVRVTNSMSEACSWSLMKTFNSACTCTLIIMMHANRFKLADPGPKVLGSVSGLNISFETMFSRKSTIQVQIHPPVSSVSNIAGISDM